jgi:NAD(P)-dependent dehydrogenase (short-subunit alcohol dehydrogenase family)
MKIRDSVALVTGANRGLGLVFVQELIAAGTRKVYAAARDPKNITLASATPASLDVTKRAAAARAFTDVNEYIQGAIRSTEALLRNRRDPKLGVAH